MAPTEVPGVALLDVNVLIALHDADHVHHTQAAQWFVDNIRHGWATCPITQNGCVRILSQPGYPNPAPMQQVLAMLAQSCAQAQHVFWADDISLLDKTRLHHAHMHGPRQLTDLYLLALAVRHGGRFVTFDARVPLSAVQGAQRRHLVAI